MTPPRTNFAEPVTLQGRYAILEPLTAEHCEALKLAAADGELWTLWYTMIPKPEGMKAEIERRLVLHASGAMLPFAVRDRRSDSIVGMTSYLNIDALNRRLEIGSTWYAQRMQRTLLNTDCKRLLLGHAFTKLGCIAVEFRTHIMNRASRAAIERLSAKQDGVLRNHQRLADGSYRDTVVYSIIESEWPAVKTHLDFQLARQ